MHILCLGLNHQTAGLTLRERLAFTPESTKAALARLGCGQDSETEGISCISELIILSTCNRVELYAVSSTANFSALEDFLAEVRSTPRSVFSPHLYRKLDEGAVEHLFRVAAGLDSLVLGEPQIMGQVVDAFELARGQDTAGPVLSRLFQAALYTGKRARTETAISHNPASISSAAIYLASQAMPALPSAQVTIVGAGEMAELAVEALRKRGVERIQVVNRTLDRAAALAERWGGKALTFEDLPDAIRAADILITSTGAPHTVIPAPVVAAAMAVRPARPLVIIDIAVPRDVEEAAKDIPGVRLYDIDRLHEFLENSLARRAGETPQVEAIIAEECQVFMKYLQSLDVLPLIAEMSQQAERIRQAELEKTLRRMPDLSEEERLRLEALTQALVKKLLHQPITQLRAEAGRPSAAECAAATRKLFGLL
jgi:glutamyl-tRNA reductase